MINNKSISVVVGLGKTGHSLARYLLRKKIPFVVYDTRLTVEGIDAFFAEFPGIDVYLGDFPESLLNQVTAVYCSPGVSLDEPFLQQARFRQLPICGDIECLVREISAPILAITGTNGKSTVTTLVGEMAKAAGLRVAVAGNIGLPVLDLLATEQVYDLWVLELSSFQLDLTDSLVPLAAALLNISSDHLDRHHGLDAYIAAKQRIFRQAQTMVFNREDDKTLPAMNQSQISSSIRSISFGLDAPSAGNWGTIESETGTMLSYGTQRLMSVDQLKLKGRHNWANALAACALAQAAGIDFECMVLVLRSFTGLAHRVQWVRSIAGVDWIDDSKGTNIGATISALSGIGGSVQGKIVLIAGGQGKGAEFSELRKPIAQYVRYLVLMGEDASLMQQALADVVDLHRATSLDEAVRVAHQHAQPGDVVLLSPACASLDMFRDYNHRGEAFVSAVNAL